MKILNVGKLVRFYYVLVIFFYYFCLQKIWDQKCCFDIFVEFVKGIKNSINIVISYKELLYWKF